MPVAPTSRGEETGRSVRLAGVQGSQESGDRGEKLSEDEER